MPLDYRCVLGPFCGAPALTALNLWFLAKIRGSRTMPGKSTVGSGCARAVSLGRPVPRGGPQRRKRTGASSSHPPGSSNPVINNFPNLEGPYRPALSGESARVDRRQRRGERASKGPPAFSLHPQKGPWSIPWPRARGRVSASTGKGRWPDR